MRQLILTSSLYAVLTAAALAQPFATPEELLTAFYEPYFTGEFAEDDSPFRSKALNQLYLEDEKNTPPGEMGAISADPYIDGQDFMLSNFKVGEAVITGDTAIVDVYFENFDRPTTITYDLVFEDGGWKIDDVSAEGEDYAYRLTEIFEEAKQFW